MSASIVGAAALILAAIALSHWALHPGSPRGVPGITQLFTSSYLTRPQTPRPGLLRRSAFTATGILTGLAFVPLLGTAAAAPAIALAVLGYLAPRLFDERRAAGAKAAALAQIQPAIALLRAHIAMGLGLESALRKIALSPLTGVELGGRLRSVLAAYGLGTPIDLALARMGRELDSAEIEILARSIAQSRRLGVGLEETLERAEFEFVAAHDRRVSAAAERAQIRSQLLIVGCYLPAFMAMVLVPLFLGMLQGLGG